jgi:hypothetical protein
MLTYNKQKFLLLDSLEQDMVDILRENNAVIAGGAIRSIFAGEYISDYDIYPNSQDSLMKLQTYFCNNDYKLKYVSPTALSYVKDKNKIQLIKMSEMMGNVPPELLEKFDFTICMGLFDFFSGSFYLDENFLPDLSRRDLKFNIKTKYPLSSLFRMRKFVYRGYKISGTEIVKIGLAINNLKIESYSMLKEQLYGIDTLFLKELTDQLLEWAGKEYDFNEFLHLLDCYEDKYLDVVME